MMSIAFSGYLTPSPSVRKIFVLFVCKVGAFFDPPSSVWTLYIEAPLLALLLSDSVPVEIDPCPPLLQTLNSISAEKNSTIIFPLPIDLITNFLKTDNGDKAEKVD